jgi:hypothetical protein
MAAADALAAPEPPEPVDARVARRGGHRTDPKRAYSWPGQLDDRDWRRTRVHAATAYYGCICGTRFTSPTAYYTHAAKVHDR